MALFCGGHIIWDLCSYETFYLPVFFHSITNRSWYEVTVCVSVKNWYRCIPNMNEATYCDVTVFFSGFSKNSTLACTLSGHGSWVLSVDFAPDQQHFVSSSSDHTVKVWDFAQRSCVHTFKDHHDQVSLLVRWDWWCTLVSILGLPYWGWQKVCITVMQWVCQVE